MMARNPPRITPGQDDRAIYYRYIGDAIITIGLLLVYQANGRPPGICQAGLYIVVNGAAAAVGRLLEKPYHFIAAKRAIRCSPRWTAFSRARESGAVGGAGGW
jgi:hypothetical protein